jgi:hypothetical protein
MNVREECDSCKLGAEKKAPQRTVIDEGLGHVVDYFTFVNLPDLGWLIGSKSDEILLMGIS